MSEERTKIQEIGAKMKAWTNKTVDDVQEFSYNTLEEVEDLGDKALDRGEYMAHKASQGVQEAAHATEGFFEKTADRMRNLKDKMRNNK